MRMTGAGGAVAAVAGGLSVFIGGGRLEEKESQIGLVRAMVRATGMVRDMYGADDSTGVGSSSTCLLNVE